MTNVTDDQWQPRPAGQVLSKLDAARLQLDGAIELFFGGNWAGALTLACAASELLDGYLGAKGDETSIDFLHKSWLVLNDPDATRKALADTFLANRNWLKHKSELNSERFIGEFEATMHLMVAVSSYAQVTDKTTTPAIAEFRRQLPQVMRRLKAAQEASGGS